MRLLTDRRSTGVYLLISLASVTLVMLFASHLGETVAMIVTNWIYTPIAGMLVILSIIFSARNGIAGYHGKAWFFFALCVSSWFIAEHIWLIYDLVYEKDPFPSEADIFYMLGSGFYLAFSILYIKSIKNAVSKKMLAGAIAIAVSLVIPSLYFVSTMHSEEDQFAIFLAAGYTLVDSITLIPAILGIVLFFGGKVHFLWSLLLIGIIFNVIGDTGFLLATLDGSYYTGHPIDIVYLWPYLLFAFGLYDHMRIFKKRSKENRFNEQESLK